jgi:hypothetical protein
MKTISTILCLLVLGMITFASPTASRSQSPGRTPSPTGQQNSPDATSHEKMKFTLLVMGNGWTKQGDAFSTMNYESAAHIKVYLKIVHLQSRDDAKKEYDARLKEAAKIIDEGKVQDKPATKPASTEDRAVILVPNAAKDCEEIFTVVATAGTVLRIIQSCSVEAAVEFERQAKRGESLDDRLVFR